MKERGNSHQLDSLFCGHFNCSKSMFLCLFSFPMTWCFKKKPHTASSSPTNTSRMNIIPMGTNKVAPSALKSAHGQLSWNHSHQIQHHKPVIGFAEFLLGEICFLQDDDSEIHWRRPHSTASNEDTVIFVFSKWVQEEQGWDVLEPVGLAHRYTGT